MTEHKEQNLAWIDLEMTGLCPEKDYILEIASLVTDNQLNIIAQGPSIIIHQPEAALRMMNDWVAKQHAKTGLVEAVERSIITVEQAEQETIAFLGTYCKPGTSPLCGNSVWQDRAFIRLAMPSLNNFLHYRIIDVTSIKEVIKYWYPNDPRTAFKKQDSHRALDDIKESVAELAYYRQKFFI